MNDDNVKAEVWGRLLSLLGEKVSSVAIDTWFNDCELVELAAGELVLHTPSPYKRDVIDGNWIAPVKEALRQLLPGEYEVRVLDDAGLAARLDMQRELRGEDEEYTFERFVVGNSNKFAQAAALAVASEQPGRTYNPLFIYGQSGLGKTHLLRAIRRSLGLSHPEYNIVYVNGDDFTNDLVRAIQAGRNIEFREKYRYANVFLMDDIQFIAGKQATQEEFFHTFNTLYEAGRQIVLTCDRPPKEIAHLEDRLRTRFEWGLIADIQPPDYETRMAIIHNKARELGFALPEDVAEYISENMSANVRQLEGAVKKIRAYSDIYGERGLTVAEVTRQIKDMLRENERLITADIIIAETAKFFMLSPEDLKGPSRTRATAQARQISMYLMRTLTPLSLADIGTIFGGRDHSTVINSVRNIEDNVRAGGDNVQTIRDITSNIQTRVESNETKSPR
ncbi:MAG: chromosomal replication initiator protein DnaA [Oscillospiraceae bacterium]|jgi:chromosomal replication initiator protein|nr:chromosomal replication initiator protein DnaA [Oscillospiraceae bacterium]